MFRIASSSIILAGSEEQINFSQQSPKMLKMASKSFIHALLLFLGLFLKISRWVPLYSDLYEIVHPNLVLISLSLLTGALCGKGL